jgi:hypothetical protein
MRLLRAESVALEQDKLTYECLECGAETERFVAAKR